MSAVYICVGKLVRVAKAEVYVRLRCEMENGVDVVLAQYALHVYWRCNIAVFERKVSLLIERSRVVQCRAVVELVEGHDIVAVRVREDEMADKPTGSAHASME